MIWKGATCQAGSIDDDGRASSRKSTNLVFWPEDIEYHDRDNLILMRVELWRLTELKTYGYDTHK